MQAPRCQAGRGGAAVSALLHPSVVSVIPGGQSVAQVRNNRAILDPEIPPQLWSDLKAEGLMREDAPIGS